MNISFKTNTLWCYNFKLGQMGQQCRVMMMRIDRVFLTSTCFPITRIIPLGHSLNDAELWIFFPKYYRVYLQNLGLGCPVGETASEEKRRMRFCTKASSSSGQKHFSFRQFQSRSWGVDVGCDRRRWVFFSGPESVLKCNICSCQGMERKREKTHINIKSRMSFLLETPCYLKAKWKFLCRTQNK